MGTARYRVPTDVARSEAHRPTYVVFLPPKLNWNLIDPLGKLSSIIENTGDKRSS